MYSHGIDDLRELESKLRAAYIAKENATLVTERNLRKLKDQRDECLIQDFSQRLLNKNQDIEKQRAIESLKKKNEYRKSLLEQIHEKEKRRKSAEITEETAITENDDEKFRLYEKQRKQYELRNGLEECIKMKKAAKELEKQIFEEEQKKLAEIQKESNERIANERAKFIKDRNNKMKVQAVVSSILERENNKGKEEEKILQELECEMKRLNEEKRFKEAQFEEEKKKIRIRNEQLEYMRIKSRYAEEQERQKSAELSKLSELQREEKLLEQHKKEKQLTKKIEYRKELKEIMEENRKRRIQEDVQKKKEQDKMVEYERLRNQLIEEERLRLLQQHLPNVKGFIPPRIIKLCDLPLLESHNQK